jgi:hypothetical protein
VYGVRTRVGLTGGLLTPMLSCVVSYFSSAPSVILYAGFVSWRAVSVAVYELEGVIAHVTLQFTRHARNRMRLYRITTEDVQEVFRDSAIVPEIEGNRTVLLGKPKAKFSHRPLKVVYVEEPGRHLVLSVYPLKRAYRRAQP